MADITLEKNLPHNVDAERSILGSVLLENRALNQAQEILREGDFYRDGHRRIFRAMEALREGSGVIDLITLKNELDRAGDLESVGGPGYIASLVDGVPKSANVEHYARIVKEKALMRALIEASHRIQTLCFEGELPVQDVLDEAQKQIFSLAEGHLTNGFVPVKELAGPTLEYIDKLHDRQELVTGLATGFERFDELTSGLQPTDLIVLAARPSMGKTALALNMAQNVATRLGRTVGVFSLEMSKEQLFLRMLCAQARVDAHHLRTGRLGKDEWARLTMAFAELTEARIFVDDTPGMSIFEMRAKARRLKSERGLDLVIVDYLQLMRGRGRYENRTQEVSDISRSLKGLAKELRVPLIALSQLSRAPEQRGGDHKPQLSDLRECVTGETQVQLANGERVPIRSLVGSTPGVVAVDQSGRLVTAASDLVWAVGRRPILRITLASGRSLRATGRHRLLASTGWRRMDELRPDDRVAVRGVSRENRVRFHVAPSRTLMLEHAELLDDPGLRSRATNDLFWDRVVSVVDDGEEEVYDLTVPGPASWLADGIVSHNSGAIEQDADVVMFIYREEVYRPTEDNRGMARLLIEKQRNGPTGVVDLAFIKEYTKFENLEWRSG
jgi:replicative DNA helicase